MYVVTVCNYFEVNGFYSAGISLSAPKRIAKGNEEGKEMKERKMKRRRRRRKRNQNQNQIFNDYNFIREPKLSFSRLSDNYELLNFNTAPSLQPKYISPQNK